MTMKADVYVDVESQATSPNRLKPRNVVKDLEKERGWGGAKVVQSPTSVKRRSWAQTFLLAAAAVVMFCLLCLGAYAYLDQCRLDDLHFRQVSARASGYDGVISGSRAGHKLGWAHDMAAGFISKFIPEEARTPFLDWKKYYPEGQALLDNFDAIRAEAQKIVDQMEKVPVFGDVEGNNAGLSGKAGEPKWRTHVLKYYGPWNEKNCQVTPAATAALKKGNPELAMFSVFEPNKALYLHFGATPTAVRLQLPLIIPEGAWIEVNGERRYWKEGELMMFDDTFMHQVQNGNGPRVVLFLDVPRPEVPGWLHSFVKFAAGDYFRKVDKRVEQEAAKVAQARNQLN